jgi:predicted alpha/beta-hydrolase family hydrolase
VSAPQAERLGLVLGADSDVSALALTPARPQAALVLAHGAGAGMEHPFMHALAAALAQRAVATLRFNFPFIERGSRRPDPPATAQAAVRAAVSEARARWPELPLLAGGKSFGGRMTCAAQADAPLPGVRGLVLVGYPLHPAGRPSVRRATHLASIAVPMLFLQGSRDALADLRLLRPVLEPLGARAELVVLDDADHGFHVAKRSGRTDEEVLQALADAIGRFAASTPA